MAISYDSCASGIGSSLISPYSLVLSSLTVGAGSNRLLVAVIGWNSSGAIDVDPAWNGTSMTLADGLESYSTRNVQVFYLANPDSGNQDLIVSFNGSISNVGVAGISFEGVDQSTPIGDTNSQGVDNKVGTSFDITTTKANSWILTTANYESSGGGLSTPADYTNRWANAASGSPDYAGSTRATTSTGDYAAGYPHSYVVNQENVTVAVEIKEYSAGGEVVQDIVQPGIIAFSR